MNQKIYNLEPEDQLIVDRYILRKGGSPAWKTVQKSQTEQCIGMIGKPLSEIAGDDIFTVRDLITGSKYKPNYQRQLVKALRNFFLWYGKQTGADFTDIEGIKLPKAQWKTKNPEDMLSPHDIETILKACKNQRDRCFIAMMWDGSNRSIELLSLNWEDLKSDQYGYYFKTSAKTGKERQIRLTISIPYIDEWKRYYPGETAGDNPVFVTIHKVKGEYPRWNRIAAQATMKELKKDTGFKNLKLSIFRPSRITDDVKNGYDLAFVMKKNWGNLKTNMIDLYTNLDADFVDQETLRKAGMARIETLKEKDQHMIEVPVCARCGTMNTLGSSFCSKCSGALTDQAHEQVQSDEQRLFEQFKKFMAEQKLSP
jgi:integrase/ribosomal protein L40E